MTSAARAAADLLGVSAPAPTRRALLGATAALVAGTALGLPTGAAAAAVPTPRTPLARSAARPTAPAGRRRLPAPRVPTAAPVRPAPAATPVTGSGLLHLLRRATYGLTPELVAEATRLGASAWLEQQLQPERLDDSACDAVVARFRRYADSPPVLHRDLRSGSWDAMVDTQRAAFARACLSRRQLLEVMVELWSDHLNVTCPSSDVWATRGLYDRAAIRPHALGRFSDLLAAATTSPAMLQYLDTATSKGSAPNENHARELLELHTVGRDAGYRREELRDVARALSGLSVWTPWNGGTPDVLGLGRYRPEWHAVGPLRVLGWSHPNADRDAGPAVVDSLVRHLARHPATAARVARRLCVRFVADEPPQALVDRLAAVYLASDTHVVPVLRALFASPEFAASAGRKQRRPYEDLVATVRVLGLRPSSEPLTRTFGDLVWEVGQAGHAPFAWSAPDGYPDVASAWTSTGSTLGRWNLHLGLASGWWKDGGLLYPGASLCERLLGAGRPATRADLVTATCARLMPGTVLPAAHRDALVTFLGGPGPVREGDRTWQYPVLVALLLDSPHWSSR